MDLPEGRDIIKKFESHMICIEFLNSLDELSVFYIENPLIICPKKNESQYIRYPYILSFVVSKRLLDNVV